MIFVYCFRDVFMKNFEWILPISTILFIIGVLFYAIPEEETTLRTIRRDEINRIKTDHKIILELNTAIQFKLLEMEGKVDSLVNMMSGNEYSIKYKRKEIYN